jgi:hypothetical protein
LKLPAAPLKLFIGAIDFPLFSLQKKSTIRNPQSEMPIAPKERRIERVFFLGYFEKKSLGRRLGESKTS